MHKRMRIEEPAVIVTVNPRVYPLGTIYSAAYVFLDRAYILLDGDPEKEITVRMQPKQTYDLQKIGNEFYNELLLYADYSKRAHETKKIRETILQRALITNDPTPLYPSYCPCDDTFDIHEYLKDTKGVSIPWKKENTRKYKRKKK